MHKLRKVQITIFLLAACLLSFSLTQAQFLEDFEKSTPIFQENGLPGWNSIHGDGEVHFTQKIENGHAILKVDTRQDKRNIWYAFTQRSVTDAMNLKELSRPHRALRIEARVRPSHAPRRVNLYLPIAGQTRQYDNLLEFDLPKANEWYTISMTVEGMDVKTEDRLIAQISMMDWGNQGTYQLDVDYMQVEIIDTRRAEPDQGNAVRYRPPLADPASFAISRQVAEDVSIDSSFPEINFHEWIAEGERTLPVDATKTILLQWDFSDLRGQQVAGEGQLEFFTHRLARLRENPKDFGEVRISEIIAGNKMWQEASVTYHSFLRGQPYHEVINEQTTVDTPLASEKGSKVVVTLSQPVLQRLVDGVTSGLAIRPLGLIDASLMDQTNEEGRYAARIRLNVQP
jgi:hypothetical protein